MVFVWPSISLGVGGVLPRDSQNASQLVATEVVRELVRSNASEQAAVWNIFMHPSACGPRVTNRLDPGVCHVDWQPAGELEQCIPWDFCDVDLELAESS